MIKLTIFTDVFPPQIGGGTYLESLADYLFATNNYQIQIITGPLPPNQHYPLKVNYQIRVIDHLNSFVKDFSQLSGCLNQLHYYLDDFKPHIVYVNNYAPQILLNFLSSSRSYKTVFSCHNTPTPDLGKIVGIFPKNQDLEITLGNYIFTQTKFDLMIAPSNYYLNWWHKLGVPKNKTALNYLGVDTSLFHPGAREPRPSPKLLCVARLVPRKGVQDVITALSLLPSEFTLDIAAGLGNYSSNNFYRELLSLIDRLKLKTRIFWYLNKFTHTQMPQIYRQAGITIVPSHFEGLGLVTLEAMACGSPVIATNVVGTNEIIKPNINCLAIPSKSPKALATAVLKMTLNPELTQTLTQTALNDIKTHWDFSFTLKRFNKLFSNLVN